MLIDTKLIVWPKLASLAISIQLLVCYIERDTKMDNLNLITGKHQILIKEYSTKELTNTDKITGQRIKTKKLF